MKNRLVDSLLGYIYGESLDRDVRGASSSLILAGLDSFSYLSSYSLMKNLVKAQEGDYGPIWQEDPVLDQALASFKRGVHPDDTGKKARDKRSPLIFARTWPLAIYSIKAFNLKREKKEAEDFVMRKLSSSHRDPTSLYLAGLYSQLIWGLLRGEDRSLIDKIYKKSRDFQESYTDRVFNQALEILMREESLRAAYRASQDSLVRALVGSLGVFIYEDRPQDFYQINEIKEIRSLALSAWLSIN